MAREASMHRAYTANRKEHDGRKVSDKGKSNTCKEVQAGIKEMKADCL